MTIDSVDWLLCLCAFWSSSLQNTQSVSCSPAVFTVATVRARKQSPAPRLRVMTAHSISSRCSWETRERPRYDRSPVIPANSPLHSTDNRGGRGEAGPKRDHIRAWHTLSTSPLNKTWRSSNPWHSAWARHANKRRLDPCDTWEETLGPHACWSVTL